MINKERGNKLFLPRYIRWVLRWI